MKVNEEQTPGTFWRRSVWEGITCSVWSMREGCELGCGVELVLVGPRKTGKAHLFGTL